MSEPHTWAEFCAQDPKVLWGQTARLSAYVMSPNVIAEHTLHKLLQGVQEGAWQRGYRIDPMTVKIPATDPSSDPLNQWVTLGVKAEGLLEPQAQQFLVWAELLVRRYKEEAETVKHRTTWRGFLRYQWNLLLDKFRRDAFDE